MSLNLQPVPVATGGDDRDGRLAFADGFRVAVPARLSEQHGEGAGGWFLEAGFGPLDDPRPPVVADLEEAQARIADRLGKA